ncbi:MAG: YncE family protein [Acidobacteria bacterium]|nr:YncE family protein [Acidobacteriota bacterium]
MNVNSRRLAVLLLTAVLIVPTVRIQVAAGVIPIDFQARTVSPAGKLIVDAETKLPAVMPLTFNFVRSPDSSGADGKGRYLIAVNSGYGLTFNSGSKNQQTLSVIDLNLRPEPQVIQNVYFPAPQSANFGLVFDSKPQASGKFNLYLSGGFENKIWILSFDPSAAKPLSPANAPDTEVKAPFIDVAAFAENAPTPNYNDNVAAVYPTGIDLSPDGTALFVANNLGDSLGVISDLRDQRRIVRIKLGRPGSKQFVYPYDVKIKPSLNGKTAGKIYVSCWGDGSVAVVDGATNRVRKHIAVGRHPTQMLFNHDRSRLYVVNSDGDSVSVIDTALDAEAAREPKINVRLSDQGPGGVGPQGIALSDDEKRFLWRIQKPMRWPSSGSTRRCEAASKALSRPPITPRRSRSSTESCSSPTAREPGWKIRRIRRT